MPVYHRIRLQLTLPAGETRAWILAVTCQVVIFSILVQGLTITRLAGSGTHPSIGRRHPVRTLILTLLLAPWLTAQEDPLPTDIPILFLDQKPLVVAGELKRHSTTWHGTLDNPNAWDDPDGEQSLLVADLTVYPFRVQSLILDQRIVKMRPFEPAYDLGGTNRLGHYQIDGLLKRQRDSGQNLTVSVERSTRVEAPEAVLAAAKRSSAANWIRLTNRTTREQAGKRSLWDLLRPVEPTVRWLHHDGSLQAVHTGHGNRVINRRHMGVDVFAIVETASAEVRRFVVVTYGPGK